MKNAVRKLSEATNMLQQAPAKELYTVWPQSEILKQKTVGAIQQEWIHTLLSSSHQQFMLLEFHTSHKAIETTLLLPKYQQQEAG